jgi:serine/threonine protein kinase
MNTGHTLGPYRVESTLGEGGMGVVYKAYDPHLDRAVALKVLRGAEITTEQRARFLQEARAASALNHPHIVQVYDIARDADAEFIVMEYVEGDTLDRLITSRLALPDALRYAAQVADALAAAHAAGIVHRDLKPSNIIITAASRSRPRVAKLLDFGVAKLTETAHANMLATTRVAPSGTVDGALVGTVPYMSPEQAEGRAVDSRSDVFSFGALLYEMVTGRPAFARDTSLATLSAIVHQEPAPARQVAPQLPDELTTLIARCLRKDPRRRVQVMEDVKIVLEETLEGSTSAPESHQSGTRSGARWARAATIGAAVAACALLFGYVAAQPATLAAQLLLKLPGGRVMDVSRDGIVAFAVGSPQDDIQTLRLDNGVTSDFVATPAREHMANFSPDGRWLAYTSNESGQDEVYVRPFPRTDGEARLVSIGGGSGPVWAPDGSSLYYRGASGDLMAVPTTLDPTFTPDRPQPLFRFAATYRMSATATAYDIHPDGKRFIMVSEPENPGSVPSRQIHVVLNWTEEMKRLVPAP